MRAAFARGQRARPLIYGHRGTRRGAPENTLLALGRALEQGADGAELDVRVCGSGEVIVLHDPDLQRVAGVDWVAAQTSLAELQQADLGADERVPTLDQALDLVLGAGAVLNVELKDDVPDARALVESVAQLISRRSANERARLVFSSFSLELCTALHAALPEAAIGLLFSRTIKPAPEFAASIHPQHTLANPKVIADWHARGLVVNTWTVNDPDAARALSAAGIDGIITDDVPLIRTALER